MSAKAELTLKIDWTLQRGVASPTNLAIFLLAFACFPLILRWTGPCPSHPSNPASAQHTSAFVRFCLVVIVSLWLCFAIALVAPNQH